MSKLPRRFFHLGFTIIMGTMMVTLMTCVITLVNVGPVPNFLSYWGKAFAIAYVVALPAIYFLSPLARKLTARWIETP